MTLTKIILELADIGKMYRALEDTQMKEQYEDYVKLIINNEVDAKDKDNLYNYWEGLKKE